MTQPSSHSAPSNVNFIMLAPMEGVIDYTMREMFAAIGGIDRLVTEFIRVNDKVLPKRVFTRYCPELSEQHPLATSFAANNTPVYVQLLGDKPEFLALNAIKAQQYGAAGIDLNFGCPSKFVNNSCGGAYLLQWPEKVFDIIHTVRQAVDAGTPITAKIRLGYQDKSLSQEIVSACASAGANEITIHARTKVEGYKPPAHWHTIAQLKQGIETPIIANGEIWSVQDAHDCAEKSQCERIMIGRGLIACPDLALLIKDPEHQSMSYCDSLLLMNYYFSLLNTRCEAKYRHSLIKQWTVYLRIQFPQYHLLFHQIKRIKDPQQLQASLQAELLAQAPNQSYDHLRRAIGGLDLSEYIEWMR